MANLAAANVMHRKTRTAVSVLAVGMEVAMVMLLVGMANGTLGDIADRLQNVGADVLFQPPDASLLLGATSAVMPLKYADIMREVDGVTEVTPVLKALRASGIDVVAIHHHMTDTKPMVIFLHYFGRGPAETLARGVRAAVDRLGPPVRTTKNVLFMCPHGAAKSVLATAYFKKQARARGLDVDVKAVGTEPDPAVSPVVVQHLTANGYEVPVAKPQLVSPEDLTAADLVVSLGCDVAGRPVRGEVRRWDDIPSPSADFAGADAAIKQHVDRLVDELARPGSR